MNVLLLALRERARRWVRIQAVKLGVSCVHTIDKRAWRPARVGDVGYLAVASADVCYGGGPGRVCRYCERIEFLTRADYFAQFGHDFVARVGE